MHKQSQHHGVDCQLYKSTTFT